MAGSNINAAGNFAADVENYIAKKTMPLARRQLVAYQFGDKATLPKNNGTTYTASRFDRLNLPLAPLSEGVPPLGESMPLTQVQATAQQWGDKVTLTDVAQLTIKHDLFQIAVRRVAQQMAETLERNCFNTLLSGTQINYVNKRGARSLIQPGDILSPTEINRATATMFTIGAPMFMGQTEEDAKIEAGKPTKASNSPKGMAHYVSIMHPLVEQDMRNNATVVTAWSHSDINRLYNNELGEWSGVRFTRSNMVPYFVGNALVTGVTSTTGGSLATNNYFIQVTGSPAQTQQEQQIYQVSGSLSVTGPTGSIAVTLPNIPGYVFNVYIGTSSSPVNVGTCIAGPNSGPFTGQAVQLTAGAVVTITGVGVGQVPPAAPAVGVTVFPTFIIGKSAYAQVKLDGAKFTYLNKADKSDPLNQLRVIGWKIFYGTLIQNQQFFMRIEGASANTATFG